MVDAVLAELDDTFDGDVRGRWPAQRAAGDVVEGDGVDGDVLDPLASGRSANGSTTTCCSSGSWTCASTSRRSTRPRSPRTASACSSTRSRMSSSPRSSRQAKLRRYVSSEHFSVDGTLLEAWASHKSFKPKDGPPAEPPAGRNVEVAVARREALERHPRLDDRPGGHGCIARRNNTAGDAVLRRAPVDGAPQRVDRRRRADHRRRLRRAGHRHRDARPAPRRPPGGAPSLATRATTPAASSPTSASLGFTPHVAQNTSRQRSAIDGRTTRHAGHAVSHADPQTDRGTLRLDQDHRRRPQAPLPRPTTQPGLVQASPPPSTTSSASPPSTPNPPEQPTPPEPTHGASNQPNETASHRPAPPAARRTALNPCFSAPC